MRHFAELSYRGTNYAGWQRQNNAMSIQETIEIALSTIINTPIKITGCGRTDAGVHASQYYMHFDTIEELPKGFVGRINKFLPKDIAIHRIFEVDGDSHARFDAMKRDYYYFMDFKKSPFDYELAYFYHASSKLKLERLNEAAKLLYNYEEFTPFCKLGSDVKTMRCQLFRAEWELDETRGRLTFHISANRFLRGMVRLIVGTCILVAEDKMTMTSLKHSLDNQLPLTKGWSVPAQGLYLSKIQYPFF